VDESTLLIAPSGLLFLPTQRDLMLQLLTAILALYGSGLALPEVDPEPSAEEPFFDFDSRTMF
jgi:hypothetical protein